MRYIYNVLLLIAWGLWLGGTMATFVFGLHLFHTHADIAPVANSAMFVVFALYELPLAAVSVLSAGLLLVSYRSKPAVAMLLVLILATGLAITAGMGLTPAMESLRVQGKTHTPAFRRLHAKSMITMSAQVLMLLGAGVLMPKTLESVLTSGKRGNEVVARVDVAEDAV